jgi:hypothetical protein
MDAHKHLKSRKDARLIFRKNQKVAVRCLTDRCNFEARIQNVSSSGIFIKTDQELPVGEEIAVSFTFPVEIQVYFKEKHNAYNIRKTARKKQPKLVFLGSSNSSR